MKYYLAPLEGVTNLYVRQKMDKYFATLDKYFIPFLDPKLFSLKKKEIKEIDPKNNKLNKKVVPQIISKDSKNTIWLINELIKLGYDEVNLNFGCPSSTVTTKHKGAGILDDLELLDNYLSDIFNNTNINISVKMRLGLKDTSKFYDIINILNKYPLYELIIHPRTGKEMYKGNLHLDLLDNLDKYTKFDIIYNGELNSIEDIKYITNRLPYIKGVMLGRGILSRPDMLNKEDDIDFKLNRLKNYYYDLSNSNLKDYEWGSSKFFHKQLWSYLINYFDIDKKLSKKLFKASTLEEFNEIVEGIFNTRSIKKDELTISNFI